MIPQIISASYVLLASINLIDIYMFFFSFFFFLHVLYLHGTRWIMTDLHPFLYVHAWPEAPYFITVSAFSRRNLLVAFELPLLSPSLSFYCSVSKLIFSFLITPLLRFQLPLPCSFSAATLRIFRKFQY